MSIEIRIKCMALLASVSVLGAVVRPAHGAPLVKFSAELLALSACDLQAASDSVPCPQAVLPIEAKLSFKPASAADRLSKVATSDSDGHLVINLPRGTYTVRLRKVIAAGSTLAAKNLRVSPGRVRVKRNAAPTLFLFTHKTRTAPGVSIGYNK